jgi:cyclic pyranopterin phosphate synthase
MRTNLEVKMGKPSHVDGEGKAKMVDVGGKDITKRTATASATVQLNAEAFDTVKENRSKKGDVLAVAQIAAIQVAKKTSDLIPLCHPLPLDHVEVEFQLDEKTHTIAVKSTASCTARTGVEMEAMTACSVAALTIYDMLKAVQKDIVISDIKLVKKTGGKSGDFVRKEP